MRLAAKTRLALVAAALAATCAARAQAPAPGNRADRLEWFRDAGFGLFIHWSVDGQLGGVISHSLVGAAPDYLERYFKELPRTFNPRRFHPEDWAVLAKLAGIRYVVFTTKHHSGFCMFPTATTDFSIAATPFGRDITGEIVRRFREQGIAIGFYFSPDDFHFLYRNGRTIARAPHPGVTPREFPPLFEHDRAQLRELLTRYGRVDVMFLDGPPEGLRELCWELQPETVVTRGAIETPEQYVPGVPLGGAWESNLTMGTEWPYKPAHETYKSGTQLIETLIETRAKGGNLLLNVGPKPDGELPIEQEERLREIALWNFSFGEAIGAVRPWVITNEGNVWYTRSKEGDTVYAFTTRTAWKLGETKRFTLKAVRATERTTVSVLGSTGEVLEYQPDVVPRSKWRQDDEGLHLEVTMAQRLYTDRKWPDPIAIRITHAEPGLTPPEVGDPQAEWDASARTATLRAVVGSLGKASSVEAGFQYRRKVALYEEPEPWGATALVRIEKAGPYAIRVPGLEPGRAYEFRAIVRHPLLEMYGRETPFTPR